jgi:hypothetical protein
MLALDRARLGATRALPRRPDARKGLVRTVAALPPPLPSVSLATVRRGAAAKPLAELDFGMDADDADGADGLALAFSAGEEPRTLLKPQIQPRVPQPESYFFIMATTCIAISVAILPCRVASGCPKVRPTRQAPTVPRHMRHPSILFPNRSRMGHRTSLCGLGGPRALFKDLWPARDGVVRPRRTHADMATLYLHLRATIRSPAATLP